MIGRKEVLRIAIEQIALGERLRKLAGVSAPLSIYAAPVGTIAERASGVIWPGRWTEHTGYLKWYKYGWHTGSDLNLNSPHWDADRHRPVYAIRYGEVYAVRTNVQGWGTVICIKHHDCLSRYAHCEDILVREGDRIGDGYQIAKIGNAGGRWPYHLHFDITRLDARMARYPLDWPGTARDAKSRVKRDYFDPLEFLRTHS